MQLRMLKSNTLNFLKKPKIAKTEIAYSSKGNIIRVNVKSTCSIKSLLILPKFFQILSVCITIRRGLCEEVWSI